LDSAYSRDRNEELVVRNFIILTYISHNIDHQESTFLSVIIYYICTTICLDLMIIVEACTKF